jgi:allantoicase
MQLKNLTSNEQLTLPDDLIWQDEFNWAPTVSSVSYTITGAMIVQSAAKQTGRHISLVGPADMAWVTRATVETLHDWASITLSDTNGRYQLTLSDSRQFTVAFRHDDTPVEAEPVLGIASKSDQDFYRLTLRLLEL